MKVRNGFVSNSSSSSFICGDNDLSVEKVKEKLKILLDFYNTFYDRQEKFKNVFGYIGLSESYHDDDDYDTSWYISEIGKDKFVICSNGDNSIPYDIWEFIEQGFDAHRVHHG